ncbi:MAG: GntR family transcriptional regulator [Candidatus Omnitrophota bacterium]
MGKEESLVLSGKIKNYLLNSNGGRVKEIDLARLLGVSRGSIRDVLTGLLEKGLIERKKKAGTSLRKLTLLELNEIYDLRSVLEGLAARLLSERITPGIIGELKKINREHRKAIAKEDPYLADKTDIAFHGKIIGNCGNARLARMTEDFHVLTRAFKINHRIDPFVPRTKTPYPHEKTIRYLEEMAPEKAERAARKHVDWAKECMIKLYLKQGGKEA